MTTPTLGVASATSINKVAITAPASSATLTIADGKTATISNTLTFTGTDSSSIAFGAGGTVVYTGRTISAAGIASGGGDLSSNRTITVTAATQSDMETNTSTSVAVVPGVMKNSPGVAKFWASINGADGSLNSSHGISGSSRTGAGSYTLTFSTAFSSVNNMSIIATVSNVTFAICTITSFTNSGCGLAVGNLAGSLGDPVTLFVAGYGDL